MGIASFLMDNKEVTEAKESSIEKHGDLFNAIRELKPELNNVEDRVLNNLLTIYSREFDMHKSEISAQDVADWISDAGTYGNLVFEFKDALALKNLEDLGLLDQKFIDAVTLYAKKNGFIDNEGRDASVIGETGKVLNAKELMQAILDDSCRSSANDEERANNVDRFDDELFEITMETLQDIYNNAGIEEELKTSDLTEETEIPEEIPEVEENPVKTEENIIKSANSGMITSVINKYWDVISEVNSAIATLTYGEVVYGKDEALKVLEEVVDLSTISVGMLNKVSMLLDAEKAELLQAGEEKAEEIVA